jgi:hypothetical protein
MTPEVDPRTPPTPLDFIYAHLAEKLSARHTRSILRRLADYPTPTRNSQILALLTILRDEFQSAWSYAQVGYIFNVNQGIVHRVRSQAMREIERDTGRPPILQPDQEAELIAYIPGSFQDGPPLSEASPPVCVRNLRKGSLVFMDMAASVTLPGGLQRATSHPQEDTRMQVTKDMCKIHVRDLELYVQNVPTELILNLDEVGSQEWSGRKKRDVIIPHQPSPRRIEYSVPRKEKRISCIATILMAGDVLMPLLVIHRKSADDAVWEDGWRDEQDFLIHSNDTSYVTRPIFKEHIRDIFLKYFDATRETMHVENFAGVFLSDTCSSHIDEGQWLCWHRRTFGS